MTGLIILTFIPLVVAIGFLIRMRSEQKARIAAEQELAVLANARAHDNTDPVEWQAVLAHELRSPVSAILGYEELLEDGTFGDLNPSALDAVRRIRSAADQLVALIEGLEHTAALDAAVETVPDADFLEGIVAALRYDAAARGVRIDTAPAGIEFVTVRPAAARAALLALGAAIKVTPDGALSVRTAEGAVPAVLITGSRLDPARDDGGGGVPLSGAGLRLQLARTAAKPVGGVITLDASGVLRLDLPRLPAVPPAHSD